MEVEVKLTVGPDAAPGSNLALHLTEMPGVEGYDFMPPQIENHRDTYYDTADGALRARGLTLRRRQAEGQLLITLKSAQPQQIGSTATREEWEFPLSTAALQTISRHLCRAGITVLCPSTALTAIARAEPAGDLLPQVNLCTCRTTRQIRRQADGTVIGTLCLDRVLYTTTVPYLTFYDVEVEAADPAYAADVERVAQQLQQLHDGALTPFPISKYERGYRLLPRS